MGIGKLHKRRRRPQEAARKPQHSAAEEGKPRVPGSVVVPEAADVERIAQGANHETRPWPEHVDERAAKEADEGKEAIEDGIGLVGHIGRGGMPAAGSETGQRRVYAGEAE